MEEKQKKMCGFIFFALVALGLVLVVVGMFTGVISASMMGESESIGLFDEGWDMVKEVASPTFATIAFIVALVGAAALLVDAILRVFMGKDLKILRMIGAALTLVGAVLILVAGLMLASDMNMGVVDYYSAGLGVWLGFIGGLLAAVGGGLPLLKAFD